MKISKENAFYIPGQVEQKSLEWLIDTGCTTTIVSSRLYNSMKLDERPELTPCSRVLLSADDSSIGVLGQALMNIIVGDKLVQHKVLVTDVADDGSLGTDFLKAHQMIF